MTAPGSSGTIHPGSGGGASDFELAGQLSEAVLYSNQTLPVTRIAALLGSATLSPDAHFLPAGDGGINWSAVPADWRPLLQEAAERRTLARTSGRLALPLFFGDRLLGLVAVGGRPTDYDADECRRFADLVSLFAGLLQARQDLDTRQRALAAATAKVRQQAELIDQIRDSVITMDLDGYITGWNKGAENLFGYRSDEVVGRHILMLYADTENDEDPFTTFLAHGSHEMTVRRRKKSGEIFWASISLSTAVDERGNPTGLIGYVIDVSDRVRQEETLRLHAQIFERNGEAIVVTDAEKRIVSANRAFTEITGYGEAEVIGRRPSLLQLIDADPELSAAVTDALAHGGRWRGELVDCRKSGQRYPVWVSISEIHGVGDSTQYFLMFSDVSERKEVEKQIYQLAYYDPLTGLPNRSRLFTLLEQALAEAHRSHRNGALLLLDIDRFKAINDSFGHASADQLLRELACRLQASVRNEDVVSRIGSDEFVVALLDLAHSDGAATVARKLLTAIAKPFKIGEDEVQVSAALGISLFPQDGRDAESLLRKADVAMYRAKQTGDGAYLYYASEMNLRSFERLKTEAGLRRAIERGEFVLHYQPQFDLRSGRILGAEALIRWQHPEQGLLAPGSFIGIAEETGLIVPIGDWVLDAACAQNRAWLDAGLPAVRIAINLSPRQFRQATLSQDILAVLTRHRLPSHYIELEITEGMLMHNAEAVVQMMEEFHEHGIVLSLDDFGTGYSSLSYLKRFPIDNLKIDQSFVRGLPDDPDDTMIAQAIIGLAKSLNLCVIAEGVETAAQAEFLRHADCDEVQGYWFSPPLPPAEFAALLLRVNGAAPD